MYGIYGEIISACERELAALDETGQLLEYPEIQADKAYYLSILKKYNRLTALSSALNGLKGALNELETAQSLLRESNFSQREELYGEISFCRRAAAAASSRLSVMLGGKGAGERAYCLLRGKGAAASRIAELFFQVLQEEFPSLCPLTENTFRVTGDFALLRLSLIAGAHKVFAGASREELCLFVTPDEEPFTADERDFKVDIFHSSGAGGQNINKVETAVRITHVPTGTVVTCQDERSQRANRLRAEQTIYARLKEACVQSERARMEADFKRQAKESHLCFCDGEFYDLRYQGGKRMAFPPTQTAFKAYLDALAATVK